MNYLDYRLFHHACSALLSTNQLHIPLINALDRLMLALFEMGTSLEFHSLLETSFTTVQSDPSLSELLLTAKDPSMTLSVSDWAILSYCSAVHEVLDSAWEGTYEPMVSTASVPEHVKKTLQGCRWFFSQLPLTELLNRLENDWKPLTDNLLDMLIAHLIWRASIVQPPSQAALYLRLSYLLNPNLPLVNVYLAGACLKQKLIFSTLMRESVLSEEQYGCLRLLDCFHMLPGVPCG